MSSNHPKSSVYLKSLKKSAKKVCKRNGICYDWITTATLDHPKFCSALFQDFKKHKVQLSDCLEFYAKCCYICDMTISEDDYLIELRDNLFPEQELCDSDCEGCKLCDEYSL